MCLGDPIEFFVQCEAEDFLKDVMQVVGHKPESKLASLAIPALANLVFEILQQSKVLAEFLVETLVRCLAAKFEHRALLWRRQSAEYVPSGFVRAVDVGFDICVGATSGGLDVGGRRRW
jgi:hypothetical protein